jgi:hypothetical protein
MLLLSAFGPLLLIVIVGALLFHVAVVLTHVLTPLFASVTFKLTTYVHPSFNVFVHVLFVPFDTLVYDCNAVHAQLAHSYISYLNVHPHVSLPLNVYVT